MTTLTVCFRYSTRVSPQIGNRVVDSAKEMLTNFTPNVFIYTDHYKGVESGLCVPPLLIWAPSLRVSYFSLFPPSPLFQMNTRSPGFAICLVAESTTGAYLSAEYVASPQELPEDVGKIGSQMLLQEVLQVSAALSVPI